MASRWSIGPAVLAVVIGALLAATLPTAAGAHPAQPPVSPVVGHVAFVAKNQVVRVAQIQADGTTSDFQTIGPVTKAQAGQTVTVQDLLASGNGSWVAWNELVTKGSGTHEGIINNVIVIRNIAANVTYHRSSSQFPIGFAGNRLVTSNGPHTFYASVQPSLHFVRVTDKQYPIGTYAHGVVDGPESQAPKGPKSTWSVRLTSFHGTHTTLHRYVLAPADYRLPNATWASGDGKRLAVELGNHQDFGGLGPSSLLDTFSLASGHARHQLGHYGTASAQWRVASVSYAGASDAVWAVWERATRHGATGVVATFSGGNWQRTAANGIAVAGNSAGYVVEQQGKYVSVGVDVPQFETVPTRGATLLHGSTSVPLDIEGSAFVWVR